MGIIFGFRRWFLFLRLDDKIRARITYAHVVTHPLCNVYFFTITTDYIRKLQEKVPQEHAKAQQALRAGNKSEAQLCLTRRKLMENEVKYGEWHFKTNFPFFAPIKFFGRQSVFTNRRLASHLSPNICPSVSPLGPGDLAPTGTKRGCLWLVFNLQRYTRPHSLR